MEIIEKGIAGICECCKLHRPSCDLLVWGKKHVTMICRDCLMFLRGFLESIEVNESTVWVEEDD